MVNTVASIYCVDILEHNLTTSHLPHRVPEAGGGPAGSQSGPPLAGGAGGGPAGGAGRGPGGASGGPGGASGGPGGAGGGPVGGQGPMYPQSVQEVDELQRATLRTLLDLKSALDESMRQAEESRRYFLELHQDIKGSLLGVQQELQHELLREAEKTIRRVQAIPHLLSLRRPPGWDNCTFQSSVWVHVMLFPIFFDVNVLDCHHVLPDSSYLPLDLHMHNSVLRPSDTCLCHLHPQHTHSHTGTTQEQPSLHRRRMVMQHRGRGVRSPWLVYTASRDAIPCVDGIQPSHICQLFAIHTFQTVTDVPKSTYEITK